MSTKSSSEKYKAREEAAAYLGRPLQDGEFVYKNDRTGEISIFKDRESFTKYVFGKDKYLFRMENGVTILNGMNPNSVFRRICPICGKEYYLKELATEKKTCSKECERKLKSLKNKKSNEPSKLQVRVTTVMKKKCEHCGKEFECKESEYEKRRFCSVSCARSSTVGEYTTNKNPSKEIYKPGYPGAKANGKIMEHRYVAQEEILHRVLLPEERIVHIDGINMNNDPSNLIVFDNKVSANLYQQNYASDLSIKQNPNGSYHVNKLIQVVDINRPEYKRVCKSCGRTFQLNSKDDTKEFCNKICENKFNNKYGR